MKKTNKPALSMQEKQANEQILRRMHTIENYLKNPRYKSTFPQIRSATLVHPFATVGPFRLQPSQILFTDYLVQGLYEVILKIVNISKNISRIKIIPPKSLQFSVGAPTYPNPDSGDIAPGMSIFLPIHFSPSTLQSVADRLIIGTQQDVIQLPMLAKRKAPQLQFNQKVQFPQVWIGFSSQVSIQILNKGSQCNVQISNQAKQSSFEVYPKQFIIGKNQFITVKGKFKPMNQKVYIEKFILKAKTGQIWPLIVSGKGNMLQLQLLKVGDNQHNVEDPIPTLYMRNVLPNCTVTKQVTIKNLAKVQFQYRWDLYQQDKDFKIQQQKGNFKSGQSLVSKISLFTDQLQPNSCVIKFIVIGLPSQCIRAKNMKVLNNGDVQYFSINVKTVLSKTVIKVQMPFKTIYQAPLNNKSILTYKLINQSIINQYCQVIPQYNDGFKLPQKLLIPAKQCIELPIQIIPQQSKIYRFGCGLIFEYCDCLNIEGQVHTSKSSIRLQETQIDFGLIMQGTETTKAIKIKNQNQFRNNCRLVFQQGQHYLQNQINFYCQEKELQPRFLCNLNSFILQPYSHIQIPITLLALRSQTIFFRVNILYNNQKSSKILYLLASVQQVQVSLSSYQMTILNGFIQVPCKPKKIQIKNLGNIPTTFNWKENLQQQFRYKITPSFKKILPKSSITCTIQITPQIIGSHTKKLYCEFDNANKLGFNLNLHVKGIQVVYRLLDDSKKVKRVLPSIPTNRLSLSPSKSKRSKTKIITKLVHTVSDQQQQQSQYQYPLLQSINFFNCQINKPKQIKIQIKNISSIQTFVNLKAQTYEGKIKQRPLNDSRQKTSNPLSFSISSKRKFTIKTQKVDKPIPRLFKPNKLVFSSQAGKIANYQRQLLQQQTQCLKGDKGIAIAFTPCMFKLKGHSTVNVIATLFNVTCGHFTDRLICNVAGLDTTYFPIQVFIQGSPLQVNKSQVGINFSGPFPICDLGKFMNGSQQATKIFKIKNNGPDNISIKWKMFNQLSTKIDKDIFNVYFDNPKPGTQDVVSLKFDPIQPEQQQNSCFKIDNIQNIIPPKSQIPFTIKFRSDQVDIYRSSLIANPINLDPLKNNPAIPPLAIILQAETQIPKLVVDKRKDIQEPFIFKFCMFSSGQSPRIFKQITLKNQSRSTLSLNIQIKGPFKFIQTSTNSSQKSMLDTGRGLIPTSFVLVAQSLLHIKIQFLGQKPRDLVAWPLSHHITKKGLLQVKFSNGAQQQFSLKGDLFRPKLNVFKEGQRQDDKMTQIDFGLISTKNEKLITIILTNDSPVQLKWNILHQKHNIDTRGVVVLSKLEKQDLSKKDDPDCFTFSSYSGSIPGQSLRIHPIPQTLALPCKQDHPQLVPKKVKIKFKPKLQGLYKSMFKINIQGGQDVIINLRGIGSFRQQYEQ